MKVKNEIIMTSWNGLHKLPNAFSGKTPKSLEVFELRRQIWSSYGPQYKKNFWRYVVGWKGASN